MAEYFVNTGSTSGGDGTTNATTGANRAFESLGAAITALEGSLSDDLIISCCGATADASGNTFGIAFTAANWTLNGYSITVRGNTSASDGRHEGVWSTSHYRLEGAANNFILQIDGMPITLEGIQIHNTTDANAASKCILLSNAYSLVMDGCILNSPGAGNGLFSNVGSGDTGTLQARNSVIFFPGSPVSGSEGFNSFGAGTHTIAFYNCVITGFDDGLETDAGTTTITVTNCALTNNGDDFDVAAGSWTIANCASNDGDGSSPVQPADWSTVFVDGANYDYHLAAGDTDLTGAGANLYATFTTDIDSDTRQSSGAWDIGIDIPASGPTDITGTHTADSFTATEGTHSFKVDIIRAHTADSLTVADGTHKGFVDIIASHTVETFTITEGTHGYFVDVIAAHTADALTLTEGTHTAKISIVGTHTADTLTIADGTHTYRVDIIGIHAADALTLTDGTHSWIVGDAEDITGTHSADSLTITEGTHYGQVIELDHLKGIVFAVLPKCLKSGSNPAAFSSGSFPIYRSSGGGLGELQNGANYDNGIIQFPRDAVNGGGWISTNLPGDVAIDDDFTVFAFWRFDGAVTNQNVYLMGLYEYPPYAFAITCRNFGSDYGEMRSVWYNSGGPDLCESPAAFAWEDKIWHGAAWVKNGANLSLYPYGVEMESYRTNDAFVESIDTSATWNIGIWTSSTPTAAAPFTLSALVMYNRALSDSEILELYRLGPTLGDLRGFDLGNGIMRLAPGSYTKYGISKGIGVGPSFED
jgi:hypothetical protein